jgi:hypothetical protein
MGTFSDVAELKIRILGAEAKKDLEALKAGAKEIKQELHLLEMAGEKGGDVWKQLKLLQRDVNNEMKGYTKNIDLSNASMNELRARKAQLNKELGVLKVGTKEWMDKLKEIEPVNAKIKETGERIKDATGEAKQLGEATEKVGGAWGRIKEFFVGNVIADGVRDILNSTREFVLTGINKAAEMTDLFAGIQKTTGLSRTEVEGLNAELGKIDTRTAQSELLKIGQVGGQIGVAKDEMLGFVEATNMAVVALGDEFSGGTEEVTKSLGTIKQIFKETKEMEFGPALQGIGSALNELGAAGMATAPVVADFAQRVGALGDLSPEITETLGLGAAFQELGLTAEISAGGISNILLTAAKDTEGFAKQVNLTTGEFEELIRNSPNEMLIKLAESFRGMKVDEVAKALAGLRINSQEATKVISLLSDNTDMVREKQELASVAMREATSLTKEYNVVNQTEAAQLEKSRKALEAKQVAMGTALLPTYIKLTQAGTSFIGFLADNWAMITKLGTALVAYTGLQKAYVLWTERQVAVTGIKNAIDQVKLVLEGRKVLSLQAQAAGMNVLTAAETRAAAAANAFNASLNRNVAILAITVLVMGLMEAYNKYSEAVELAEQRSLSHIKASDEEIKTEQKKLIAVEKSFKATMDLAYGTDERKKAIEGLMRAYPGYFGKLDAEQVSNWHLEQAYRRVNSQIQNKIDLMAREKQVANITNQLVDLRVDQMNNDGGGAWIGRYQNQQQQLKLTQQLENAEKGLNNTRVRGFNQEMLILNERLKNGSLVYSEYMKENNALRQKHEIGGRIFTQNEILDRQQTEMGKKVVAGAKVEGEAVEKGEGKKTAAKRKAADEEKKLIKELEDSKKELDRKLKKIDEDYAKWLEDHHKKEYDAFKDRQKKMGDSVEAIQKNIQEKELKDKKAHNDKIENLQTALSGRIRSDEEQRTRNAEAEAAKRLAIEEKTKKQKEALFALFMAGANGLLNNLEKNLDKQMALAETATEKAIIENKKAWIGVADNAMNALNQLSQGNMLGAIIAGLQTVFSAFNNWFEASARKQAAYLADLTTQLEAAGKKFMELAGGFTTAADVENINKIYEGLIKITQIPPVRIDLGENDSYERRLTQELEIGAYINSRYEKMAGNEQSLHGVRIKHIEDEYNAAVRAINDRYNLERSLADAAFAAANLAIDENTNRQLAAMVTNAESSLSITRDYESRKNFVREQFADMIRPITADMTQAEIDGINAAVAAQNEAFARVEQWYKNELTFILGNEEQKRKAYTQTEEIIRAGEELKEQNSIRFIADQLERENNRNIELAAAEANKNALIEAEGVRHNDEMKRLGLERDAALAESFQNLKDIMVAGYDDMIAKALEAFNAGKITAEQYNEIASKLFEIQKNLGLIDWSKLNIPAMPGFDWDFKFPKFADGTEYVDKLGMYPAGIDQVPAMLDRGERVLTSDQNLLLGAMSNDDVVKGAVLYRTMGAAVDQGLAAQLSNSVVHRSGSHVATAAGQMINYVTGASGGTIAGRREMGDGRLEIGGAEIRNQLNSIYNVMGAVLNELRGQTPELRKIRDRTGISLHDIVEAEGKLKEVERMSDF